MRAYVTTTGFLFGVLALIHVWRAIEEGASLATNPWFVLMTLLAAALSIWAFRLLRVTRT
jgi:hypothetical protein